MALSEVLFMENCEPCDLPVFGDEEESGRFLCVCIGEVAVPPLSERAGELEGGGFTTGDRGGAKDGTGGVLSRFKGEGAGLEKFIVAFAAITGSRSRGTFLLAGFGDVSAMVQGLSL